METPNDQIKAKFFGNYWGQNILGQHDQMSTYHKLRRFEVNGKYYKHGYLDLKHLKVATDEEVMEIAKAISDTPFMGRNVKFFTIKREKDVIYVDNKYNEHSYAIWEDGSKFVLYREAEIDITGNEIAAADLCRQKGFAVEWNGYLLEDLEEFRWTVINKDPF